MKNVSRGLNRANVASDEALYIAHQAKNADVSGANRAASAIGAGASCPPATPTNIVTTPMITPKVTGKFRITAFSFGHPATGGLSGMSSSIGTLSGVTFAALIPPTNYAGVTAAVAATSYIGYNVTYDMVDAQALDLGVPVQFALSGTATGDTYDPSVSYISVEELDS